MSCVVCFGFSLVCVCHHVPGDRHRFTDKTGYRLIPAFGVSKPITAGIRNNTFTSHKVSRLHGLAKDEVSASDLLVILKAYCSVLSHSPASSFSKWLYCDWILKYDIGKIQHTCQARNKFVLILSMEVQR